MRILHILAIHSTNWGIPSDSNNFLEAQPKTKYRLSCHLIAWGFFSDIRSYLISVSVWVHSVQLCKPRCHLMWPFDANTKCPKNKLLKILCYHNIECYFITKNLIRNKLQNDDKNTVHKCISKLHSHLSSLSSILCCVKLYYTLIQLAVR